MAAYGSVANLIALAAQAAVSIATVRLTLPYLGEERFGAWMTVMGIAGVLAFADFGIGNALVTRVAAARAGSAGVEPYVAITGGLTCLLVIGASVGLVVMAVCSMLPWNALMRVPLPAELEVEFRQSAMLFGLLFGAFLFTSGLRKVYEGLQRGYVAHAMMAICSCTSLCLLYVAVRSHCGIPLLIAATFGVTAVLPALLLGPLQWAGYFRPQSAAATGRRELRQLAVAGSQYSVVQVGSLLLNGSEPMLVASLQGGGALAGLAVVQRLFQIAATPTRLLVTPYWGAYADAHARGDREYVRRTLMRQVSTAGFLTAAIAGTMALASPWAVSLLTKGTMTADPWLVAACCGLCVLDGFLLPFGIYLNGVGCVRPQAIATVFAMFTYFPAKLAALAYGGISWMIATTIVFQILNSLLFYVVLYREEVWHAVRTK